jgi:hypothetical protein
MQVVAPKPLATFSMRLSSVAIISMSGNISAADPVTSMIWARSILIKSIF